MAGRRGPEAHFCYACTRMGCRGRRRRTWRRVANVTLRRRKRGLTATAARPQLTESSPAALPAAAHGAGIHICCEPLQPKLGGRAVRTRRFQRNNGDICRYARFAEEPETESDWPRAEAEYMVRPTTRSTARRMGPLVRDDPSPSPIGEVSK